MSDHSWVLSDIDAATSQRIAAAAARAGRSVEDFLADLLLPPACPTFVAENFPYRHRLEALERRLDGGLGALEGSLRGADGAIASLAARVADAEAAAERSLTASEAAAQESTREVNALRDSLEAADGRVAMLARHHEAARRDLAARLDQAEDRFEAAEGLAREAQRTGALLGEGHEALRQALSNDLSALSRHGASALEAARAEAKAASAQADSALRALADSFHGAQVKLEQRFAEADSVTQSRIQSAFEETLHQLQAFDARLGESESAARAAADANTTELRRRAAELHAEIASLRAHQADEQRRQTSRSTALEAAAAASTAEMRRATAGLQAEIGDAAAATRTALATEIASLQSRQDEEQRRLALLSAEVDGAAAETAALRRSFNAFAANCTGKLAEAGEALKAEAARIEACSIFALEKLAADIAAGDGRLANDAEARAKENAEQRKQLEAELAALRGQHAGMMARLQLLDRTLGMQDLANGADAPVAERLATLEQKLQEAASDQELANLHEDFSTFVGEIEREHAEQRAALARANDNSAAEQALAELRSDMAALSAHADRAQTALTGRLANDRVEFEQSLATIRRDLGLTKTRIDQQQSSFAAQFELTCTRAEFEQEIAELRQDISALDRRSGEQSSDLARDLEALRTRQDGMHTLLQEDAGRLHGMARMLTRIAAQQSEGAEMSDDRLRLVAHAIAELERSQTAEAAATSMLEQRLSELESRQSRAVELLGRDLSAVFAEQSRRLDAMEGADRIGPILERVASVVEQRLAGYEVPDFAAAFEALRHRVEERILDMERRSVRTLEQVSDTVALLERQFSPDSEDLAEGLAARSA